MILQEWTQTSVLIYEVLLCKGLSSCSFISVANSSSTPSSCSESLKDVKAVRYILSLSGSQAGGRGGVHLGASVPGACKYRRTCTQEGLDGAAASVQTFRVGHTAFISSSVTWI